MEKKVMPKLQFKKRTITILSAKEMKAVPGGGDSVFQITSACGSDFTRPQITVGCISDITRTSISIIRP